MALHYLGEHIKVLNMSHEIVYTAKEILSAGKYNDMVRQLVAFMELVCTSPPEIPSHPMSLFPAVFTGTVSGLPGARRHRGKPSARRCGQRELCTTLGPCGIDMAEGHPVGERSEKRIAVLRRLS